MKAASSEQGALGMAYRNAFRDYLERIQGEIDKDLRRLMGERLSQAQGRGQFVEELLDEMKKCAEGKR